MPLTHCLVKLDFKNAFNSIRRDCLREAVASIAPSLLGYFDSAYGATTKLFFSEHIVELAEGIQQGDPLSPLLVCLTIHPVLSDIQSDFVSGYLDDIAISGATKTVADDVRRLKNQAKVIGLQMNKNKCGIIGLSPLNQENWQSNEFCFLETPCCKASLLGAPITAGENIDSFLALKRTELEILLNRLSLTPAHTALFLIKNALAIPKLLYLLRTSCFESSELNLYDEALRVSLSSRLTVDLGHQA